MLPTTSKRRDHSPFFRKLILQYRFFYQRFKSSRKFRFSLVIALLIIAYLYKSLLFQHGTIAPPATWYFTKPFNGLSSNNYPPVDWKPKFRVVVSLTTTPNRLTKVEDAMNSLLKQSLKPDAIYLNIPSGKMKRHPDRSYDEVAIPKAIEENKEVTVLRPLDYGPATKLIPALMHEDDPSTLIITVDDDFIYPEKLVEALAWEAAANKETVLGVCGWGTMPIPASIGMVPVYVPYFMRPNGRYVDILQACCGNAYRRGFFHNLPLLKDIPSDCITVDDVWIAGYLSMTEKRKHAIISKRLDPEDTPWKKEEATSTAAKMKLSKWNDENQIHYKCLLAMEKKFQTTWKRVYHQGY